MVKMTVWLAAMAVAWACGCGGREAGRPAPSGGAGEAGTKKRTFEKVRLPAVAGSFYPDDSEALSREVDALLAQAASANLPNVRALVCPHAGYRYSGLTAAVGYRQLVGRDVKTAIVLAPSHTAAFAGAAVSDADAFRTPLGLVPVSSAAAELAKNPPFAINPLCRVQRPQWGGTVEGEPNPHTWEHSLEVQLPFLQRVLKDFELVPAVFGQLEPAAAAQTLMPLLNEKTVLIASSDLSHYEPYDTARKMDSECIRAIVDLNIGKMETQSACGAGPIMAVMHIARLKGWKTKLLDYRNSGDTAGDKSAVVGYAAVAFYEPSAEAGTPATTSSGAISDAHRKLLLELARKTLAEAVMDKKLPSVEAKDFPEPLREVRGCFVTLTKAGRLRGCIGYIFPVKPLCEAVADNAVNAALRDYRFSPVQPAELKDIHVEISVLTVPKELKFDSPEDLLARLRPNVDGVVLKFPHQQSTYLPQVWEQIPDKVEFLNSLSEKAGMPADAWRQTGLEVLTYQAEAFHESGT